MTGLETKEQQVFFDGSEVRVLQEFCQRFNCTLKVYCCEYYCVDLLCYIYNNYGMQLIKIILALYIRTEVAMV